MTNPLEANQSCPLFRPALYIIWTYSLTVFEEQEQNPMANFMCALKAPETRRQWPHKLSVFTVYLCMHVYICDEDLTGPFHQLILTYFRLLSNISTGSVFRISDRVAQPRLACAIPNLKNA